MDNPYTFTHPVARQVFLESFHLSQGDPILQGYLLRYAAVCRPAWQLSEDDRQMLRIQLVPTIRALVTRGMHCLLTRWKAGRELTNMIEIMHATFERTRADRSDMALSILRGSSSVTGASCVISLDVEERMYINSRSLGAIAGFLQQMVHFDIQ